MRKILKYLIVLLVLLPSFAFAGEGISVWDRLAGAVEAGDLIAGTDISDTNQSAEGSSKALTAGQLKAFILENIGSNTAFDGWDKDSTDAFTQADADVLYESVDPTILKIADIDSLAEFEALLFDIPEGGGDVEEAPNDAKAYARSGETWVEIPGGGDMLSSNNLSEVTPATARENLQVYSKTESTAKYSLTSFDYYTETKDLTLTLGDRTETISLLDLAPQYEASDTPFDISWDGNMTAPTSNAVFDQFQEIPAQLGGVFEPYGVTVSDISDAGSAISRAAEDTLTNGSNLPDGAAIIAYGDANWLGGSDNLGTATATDITALFTGTSGYLKKDGTVEEGIEGGAVGLLVAQAATETAAQAAIGVEVGTDIPALSCFADTDSFEACFTSIVLGGGDINSLLTGYTSTTGTVTATDSVLTAIEKLDGNTAALSSQLSDILTALGDMDIDLAGPDITCTADTAVTSDSWPISCVVTDDSGVASVTYSFNSGSSVALTLDTANTYIGTITGLTDGGTDTAVVTATDASDNSNTSTDTLTVSYTAPVAASAFPDDPAGATYITVDTDGVSGDYSTLAAAEAALPGTFTTPYVITVAASTGVADTTEVTFSGYTPDATNPLIVRPASGQEHNGEWDDSKYTLESVTDGVNVQAQYTTIRGLQIIAGSSNVGVDILNFRSHITIDANIIKDARYGIYVQSNSADHSGHTFTNNIIYDCDRSGIEFPSGIEWTTSNVVANNTVYNNNISDVASYGGIRCSSSSQVILINNLATDNGNVDFKDCVTQSYNISSDVTATGTGSLTGKSLADIDFISTTIGSEDLHIAGTSDAVGVGGDTTAYITWDIDGNTRSSSSDIGADEI